MKYTKEHIKQYLEGTLVKEVLADFEREMRADEDLRAMVDGYKILQNETKNPQNWLAEQKQNLPNAQKKSVKAYVLAAAASVLMLLSVGLGWRYFQNPKPDFDFKDAGLPVLMGKPDDLNAAMNEYKADDFVKAQHLLREYENRFGSSDTTAYYFGVFDKELGHYENALKAFDPKIYEDFTLKQKAEMQQAICFYYLGNKTASDSIIQSIKSDPNHLFYERLKNLDE